MANAIKATGKEMFYSLCNWGNENVASWAGKIANSWRTTQDISIYPKDQGGSANTWQNMKANFLKNI